MVHVLSPTVKYAIPRTPAGWELSEDTMPESLVHDEVVTYLRALLAAWAARTGAGIVARNLAVRWDQSQPKVGVDPDVALLSPAPPEGVGVSSLRLWVAGHEAPRVAIEVVSENNPRKDYELAPDKYAASGTRELWVFDPLLVGPTSKGGPFYLQLWQRDDTGAFTRTYTGAGAVYSTAVDGYLVTVDDGKKLRIASDAAATRFWLTGEGNGARREGNGARREGSGVHGEGSGARREGRSARASRAARGGAPKPPEVMGPRAEAYAFTVHREGSWIRLAGLALGA